MLGRNVKMATVPISVQVTLIVLFFWGGGPISCFYSLITAYFKKKIKYKPVYLLSENKRAGSPVPVFLFRPLALWNFPEKNHPASDECWGRPAVGWVGECPLLGHNGCDSGPCTLGSCRFRPP